jgi:hypothetical protein
MGNAKRRRAAGNYPNTQTTMKPIWEKLPTMTTFGNFKGQTVACTLEEYREGEREGRVALHESSHAVGGWLQGLPLRGMWLFKPDGERPPSVRKDALGVVLQKGAIGDKLSLPYGERIVLAKATVFMELAAVFGDGAVSSDNPCLKDSTQRHFIGAMRFYQMFVDGAVGTKILPDTVEEIERLTPIVANFFSDNRVRALTQGLANHLLETRHLSGDEIYEFLDSGWIGVNKAAERRSNYEMWQWNKYAVASRDVA